MSQEGQNEEELGFVPTEKALGDEDTTTSVTQAERKRPREDETEVHPLPEEGENAVEDADVVGLDASIPPEQQQVIVSGEVNAQIVKASDETTVVEKVDPDANNGEAENEDEEEEEVLPVEIPVGEALKLSLAREEDLKRQLGEASTELHSVKQENEVLKVTIVGRDAQVGTLRDTLDAMEKSLKVHKQQIEMNMTEKFDIHRASHELDMNKLRESARLSLLQLEAIARDRLVLRQRLASSETERKMLKAAMRNHTCRASPHGCNQELQNRVLHMISEHITKPNTEKTTSSDTNLGETMKRAATAIETQITTLSGGGSWRDALGEMVLQVDVLSNNVACVAKENGRLAEKARKLEDTVKILSNMLEQPCSLEATVPQSSIDTSSASASTGWRAVEGQVVQYDTASAAQSCSLANAALHEELLGENNALRDAVDILHACCMSNSVSKDGQPTPPNMVSVLKVKTDRCEALSRQIVAARKEIMYLRNWHAVSGHTEILAKYDDELTGNHAICSSEDEDTGKNTLLVALCERWCSRAQDTIQLIMSSEHRKRDDGNKSQSSIEEELVRARLENCKLEGELSAQRVMCNLLLSRASAASNEHAESNVTTSDETEGPKGRKRNRTEKHQSESGSSGASNSWEEYTHRLDEVLQGVTDKCTALAEYQKQYYKMREADLMDRLQFLCGAVIATDEVQRKLVISATSSTSAENESFNMEQLFTSIQKASRDTLLEKWCASPSVSVKMLGTHGSSRSTNTVTGFTHTDMATAVKSGIQTLESKHRDEIVHLKECLEQRIKDLVAQLEVYRCMPQSKAKTQVLTLSKQVAMLKDNVTKMELNATAQEQEWINNKEQELIKKEEDTAQRLEQQRREISHATKELVAKVTRDYISKEEQLQQTHKKELSETEERLKLSFTESKREFEEELQKKMKEKMMELVIKIKDLQQKLLAQQEQLNQREMNAKVVATATPAPTDNSVEIPAIPPTSALVEPSPLSTTVSVPADETEVFLPGELRKEDAVSFFPSSVTDDSGGNEQIPPPSNEGVTEAVPPVEQDAVVGEGAVFSGGTAFDETVLETPPPELAPGPEPLHESAAVVPAIAPEGDDEQDEEAENITPAVRIVDGDVDEDEDEDDENGSENAVVVKIDDGEADDGADEEEEEASGNFGSFFAE